MDNEEKKEVKLEDSEKLQKKIRRSEKSVKRYQRFILRLIVVLLVIWVLFFQVIGLTHMPNGDMYPRVDAGDLVMFYRLDKDVKAQDIAVLEKTTPESPNEKELFVCRVVAVEGDTVEFQDSVLLINGNPMVESNVFYETKPYEGYGEYPVTLQKGECFVLADYRDGGMDSRYFGVVKKEELLGTVITIVRRNNL